MHKRTPRAAGEPDTVQAIAEILELDAATSVDDVREHAARARDLVFAAERARLRELEIAARQARLETGDMTVLTTEREYAATPERPRRPVRDNPQA